MNSNGWNYTILKCDKYRSIFWYVVPKNGKLVDRK